ncbi:hypothetical protein D9M70_594190 [compost metagenome]
MFCSVWSFTLDKVGKPIHSNLIYRFRVATRLGSVSVGYDRQRLADSVEKVGVGQSHPSIAQKAADLRVAT